MTRETNERYIGGQVRSRANVILTRRDDLRVVETKEQTGLDMHVYVDREDKPMRLVFGVLLRGVPSPTTADQANKHLVPTMGFFQGLRKFTYPVCLFFFSPRKCGQKYGRSASVRQIRSSRIEAIDSPLPPI